MPVTYCKGRQDRIDYTPSSNVAAGDVVVIGSIVAYATFDIAANVLGSLATSGIVDAPKASSGAIAAGAAVYWDDTNDVVTTTASGNKRCGTVTPDGAGADGATKCRVLWFQA